MIYEGYLYVLSICGEDPSPECLEGLWMNSSPKIKKIFLLNLQGLVACDYTSANKLRGRDKGFINVIKKFNDLFMSSR